MSTLTQFLPQTGIKSVQSGTFSIVGSDTTGTATISSVNTAKSFLVFLGAGESGIYIYLQDATTIIAARPAGTTTRTVSYSVVEFN